MEKKMSEYKGIYQYAKSDTFMQGKPRFQKDKQIGDTILTNGKWGGYLWKTKNIELEN
jgi:hypothetical protein